MKLSFQVVALCWLQFVASAQTTTMRYLRGHVPAVVAHLQAIDRVSATNRLTLAIGLPLRNTNKLAQLVQQIYDPASPQFHHYLTPEEFTETYGPTREDYAAVAAFAAANGLEIVGTHSNRMLLDVTGSVASVERAFNMNMRVYQHPTENRVFFAPDVEPSVPAPLSILSVAGLNNYVLPHRNLKPKPLAAALPENGSGPQGNLLGNDFRAAYVPGAALTGAGQSVGLFQLDSGFYQSDITAYENLAGLPNVPVSAVLVDGYNGKAGSGNDEVSLDIEMTMAMAPGLAHIYVYEGTTVDDILNRMAADTSVEQFSSSWSYSIDSETEQIYQEFAAQGQSFFNASGDGDAWVGTIDTPCDDPNITIVGGTTLTMSGTGSAYGAESVWNDGFDPPGWNGNDDYWGSSGGISTVYSIPSWQKAVSMTSNQGSTTMRNVPDVAMNADNVWVIYGNGSSGAFVGTSCASPLWAGFAALVNEQATNNGLSPVGFLNPALYQLGLGTNYSATFHDTKTGNNIWPGSLGKFSAVAGYDLCTGWGSPMGTNLINALALPSTGSPSNSTGSLQVTISPAAANDAGAAWLVDGGASQTSGATVSGLAAGNHVVSFTAIAGWTTPSSQTITVNANSTATATGAYVSASANGALQVTILPAAVVSAGAVWQVDGTNETSGTTVTNLSVGNHLVTFSSVSGWTAPPSQTIGVSASATTTTTGTYDFIAVTGSLLVTITPAAAVSAGAAWQVDGTNEASGTTVTNLSVGNHLVAFSAVTGWTPPASQTIPVYANATATDVGVYAAIPQTGSLQVRITPANAVIAGARWQVDGGNFQNSEAIVTGLSAGTHTVAFEAAPGWSPPANQTVTISAGLNLNDIGLYTATNPPAYGVTFITNGSGTIRHGAWPETLILGEKYTVTAVPKTGNLFQSWTDGSSSNFTLSDNASYSFTYKPNLVLEANFVTNMFLAAKGDYHGLFAPVNSERTQDNSGGFNFNLTAAGAVSGTLRIGSSSVALNGKFDVAGGATMTSARQGGGSLTTVLQLDATNQAVFGTVSDGTFIAELSGYQNVFNSRNKAVDYEGRYTLIIPGTNDPAIGPYGTSYGMVLVGGTGNITFTGSLADGTAVSQSSVVSGNGYWPMYVPLYGGKGSLWGWNYFTNGAITSASYVSWINLTNASKTAVYRSGFTNQEAVVMGTNYSASGMPLLGLTQGEIILAGGGLPDVITNEMTPAPDRKFLFAEASGTTNKIVLTVHNTTGAVTGSFRNPSNPGQTVKVNGVLMPGQGNAAGYFLGTNQSGTFTFEFQ